MTAREPAVLSVRDLHVAFPGASGPVPAVRGVGYDLARGEALGIVGESGSGKSVTALAVLGLLPGTADVRGSVRLDGEELLGRDDATLSKIRGARVSMVFQDPLSALTPVYSVGDQVAEAVRAHTGQSRVRAGRRAVELLELVGIPDAARRARAFPHEFSGGMRQRVMIAMAVANDPDVIIADEPTTALDVTVQAQILDVFATARAATGAAVVLITHDLGVVAGFADRVLVMYAGRVVESGEVADIYERPRMPYTMGLLGAVPRVDAGAAARTPLVPIDGAPPSPAALPAGCPFRPRCPLAVDACRTAEPDLLPVGRPGHGAACHRREDIEDAGMTPAGVFAVPGIPPPAAVARPRAERPEVLSVEGLVRHYPLTRGAVVRRRAGTVRAVDGVGFDIRAGETLGLVGESGSGKTTTLLEVLALARPQGGRISVFGRDTATLTRKRRAALRRDVQVVFQDPMAALDPRMPVADILAEPLRAQHWPCDRVHARVRRLLDLVGLAPEHRARYPADFSGGQRQRIGIARALAPEPRLVVLDEPVSALDVSIQAGIINLLADLRADLAYLFVSHDLAVVRHIADRVAVMYLGRIVEIGAVDAVFAAPAHPYTRALLSAIPIPDPRAERARTRVLLTGDLPGPAGLPPGCRFHPRCPMYAGGLGDDERRVCREADPALEPVRTGADQRAACHYASSWRAIERKGRSS